MRHRDTLKKKSFSHIALIMRISLSRLTTILPPKPQTFSPRKNKIVVTR